MGHQGGEPLSAPPKVTGRQNWGAGGVNPLTTSRGDKLGCQGVYPTLPPPTHREMTTHGSPTFPPPHGAKGGNPRAPPNHHVPPFLHPPPQVHTGAGEHVVELDDEVIVAVEALEADEGGGVHVGVIFIQLHLGAVIVILLFLPFLPFLIILRETTPGGAEGVCVSGSPLTRQESTLS